MDRETDSVVPPAPWIGGKRRLAREIIARLRRIPHATYVEPFLGMGGIFLRRPSRSKAEVVNDLSTDVITLFRCLQRHYVPLMDMLRWQVTSRDQFERLRRATADALTDLERSVRFLYLQRLAFGGKVRGRNFGISPGIPARFDVTKLGGILEAVHERLAGVVIECLPYPELLARYDRPGTLFYLDPPYHGSEDDYGEGMFSHTDYERLAGLLNALKGRWLLSLNDTPEIRRIFCGFTLDRVEASYSINPTVAARRMGELLITPRS